MNKILNKIHKLCPPAQLYFVISVLSFLGMLLQNCGSKSEYQIGTFKAPTPCHPMYYFLAKALYILFWTYGLNFLCQKGFKQVSWGLVLLPIIGMFIMIGLLLFSLIKTEGFESIIEANSIDDEEFDNEGMEGIDDDDDDDNMESFEKPMMPAGSPLKEGFEEGNEQECEDGKIWDDGANMCVTNDKGTFANRITNLMEGFREGSTSNPCPEGETYNEKKSKCEAFVSREGMQNCDQGMQWDDNEQKCVSSGFENAEGFEMGGDRWPQIGSLI